MSTLIRFAAAFAVAGLLAMVIACADQADSQDGDASDAESAALAELKAEWGEARGKSPADSGIWVLGQSSINVEPDLVMLNVGVEATAATVAEARAEAAKTMDALIMTIKASGVRDEDIQTVSFNIWPQYEYPEVLDGDMMVRKEILAGYRVFNSVRIKIRDIDSAGSIIDKATEAGGDATRIDDIRFAIDDPTTFEAELREEAVKDALAKAEHLSSLAGVELGDLFHISGDGLSSFGGPSQAFAEQAMLARAQFDYVSPIGAGELTLRMAVLAGFSVE